MERALATVEQPALVLKIAGGLCAAIHGVLALTSAISLLVGCMGAGMQGLMTLAAGPETGDLFMLMWSIWTLLVGVLCVPVYAGAVYAGFTTVQAGVALSELRDLEQIVKGARLAVGAPAAALVFNALASITTLSLCSLFAWVPLQVLVLLAGTAAYVLVNQALDADEVTAQLA